MPNNQNDDKYKKATLSENTDTDDAYVPSKKRKFKITPRRIQKTLHFSLLIILLTFVSFQLTSWIYNQTSAMPIVEPSEQSSFVQSSVPTSSTPESSILESSATTSSTPESSILESSATTSSAPESSILESSATTSSAPESSILESSATTSSAPESSILESSVPTSSAPESSTEASNDKPTNPHAYFKNTAFMGNSLISGFDVYGIEPNADYYWSIGMSVYGALHTPMSNSEYTAVEQICMHGSYDKIFLMFGTNELGWSNSNSFINSYGQVIDELKSTMPNTQIYIQSITPVTASVDKKNQNGINNARIEEYNTLLEQLSVQKNVGYLDIASIYKDSNGNMADKYSGGDGIHLSPSAYYLWLDYIMANV